VDMVLGDLDWWHNDQTYVGGDPPVVDVDSSSGGDNRPHVWEVNESATGTPTVGKRPCKEPTLK